VVLVPVVLVLQHRLLLVEIVLQLVVRMVVLLQRCERCFRSAIQTDRWTPWWWWRWWWVSAAA
jgi:hypothetical protein